MQRVAGRDTSPVSSQSGDTHAELWVWRWDTNRKSVLIHSPDGEHRTIPEREWFDQIVAPDRLTVSRWRNQLCSAEIRRYQLVFRWMIEGRTRWVVEIARAYGRTTGRQSHVVGAARIVSAFQFPRSEPDHAAHPSRVRPSVAHGVVVCDSEGMVRQWNARLTAITGVSAEYAQGRPLWELQASVSPATIPYERAVLAAERECRRLLAQVRNRRDWREVFEYEVLAATGGSRWIELMVFPMVVNQEPRLAALVTDRTGL